jgi:hypothetical protein
LALQVLTLAMKLPTLSKLVRLLLHKAPFA